MALFSGRTKRRSRRALRRAHTKELKARAKAERKFEETARRKQAKLDARAAKKSERDGSPSRRERRAMRAADQDVSRPATKKAGGGKARDTNAAATARSYLAVARVVAPVLAPFAYRAAAAARGQLDAVRARKIGVGVEQLANFSGYGAALSAQIAGLEPALHELVRGNADADTTAFHDRTVARLAELSTAVHAAERMPTARRKAAHRSVAQELDQIDAQLLSRLGVR